MKKINRSYKDTEIIALAVQVKCPYCGEEWLEEDSDKCGETYIINCEDCGEKFEMYFDAD